MEEESTSKKKIQNQKRKLIVEHWRFHGRLETVGNATKRETEKTRTIEEG